MNENEIQDIASLAVSANRPPILDQMDVPVVITPDNCRLQSLEHYLAAPTRMKESFQTERLSDFAKYVDNHGDQENTVIFLRPDGSGAKAVFDRGTPEHPLWGDHTATLSVPFTTEFHAIQHQCQSGAISQRDLIHFLEDWRHVLGAEVDDENVSIGQAINAIRSVTVESIQRVNSEDADFEASLSALDKISAKSESGRLPQIFRATVAVRKCNEPTQTELRLSLVTSESKPHFKLRMVQYDKIIEDSAKEVEALITEAMPDLQLYVGTVG